jgi:spore coat protein U-like protein
MFLCLKISANWPYQSLSRSLEKPGTDEEKFEMERVVKRTVLAVAALVVSAIALSEEAQASGTATGSLSVTAAISNNCTISTAAVAFGAYDPIGANLATALVGTGTITTTCTSGSAPVITLGQGANAGGGSTDPVPVRQMANAANRMAYSLYSDSGRTTVWGNTVATAPGSVAGTDVAQNFTVYGRIPAAQNLPSGSYADTVVATVTF